MYGPDYLKTMQALEVLEVCLGQFWARSKVAFVKSLLSGVSHSVKLFLLFRVLRVYDYSLLLQLLCSFEQKPYLSVLHLSQISEMRYLLSSKLSTVKSDSDGSTLYRIILSQ